MAGYSVSARNVMLNALAAVITHVSAHTADPGETGASEVSGGSYARQSITWNAASAGNLDSSNVPVIPIPAGVTVTHIGWWTALSGGTCHGGKALTTPETFGSAGSLEVTDLDLGVLAQ